MPISKPDLWGGDPPPSSPSPPNPGESHEDYNVEYALARRYYHKRWVDWCDRQRRREEDRKSREPKQVYTLHPRSRVFDAVLLLAASMFVAATIYLAIAAGN